ncbi:MAG: hypothetical protein ACYDDS_21530 [Candidatus Sulfotelmatobacter sp.]
MTDPVAVTNLALALLGKTTEALNALRERAQRTKDLDIKDQINTLYDNVLSLKEVMGRLLDENKELKRLLEQQQNVPEKPKITQAGDTNYYYLKGEGPYCQPCYDKTVKLVPLLPEQRTSWGAAKRDCPVCHQTFYEKKRDSAPGRQVFGGGRWS